MRRVSTRYNRPALKEPEQPPAVFEAIERHYQQSPFIREVCVFAAHLADHNRDAGLHAVVVPDAAVLRERKIVNVKELIRFELEGLSLALPAPHRVVHFDVTMGALPRNVAGTLDRAEVANLYRTGRLRTPRVERPVPLDEHTTRIVALVQEAVGSSVVVRPDSNLELDLGLDSIDRVELLARLEQRFDTRVAPEGAQSAFLVSDLAAAFRGSNEAPIERPFSWESLIHSGEPDAAVKALLAPRAVTALVVFILLRTLVRPLARPRAIGLEHLPRNGPFIVTPNHQSYIDPLVLMSVLPFGVIHRLFFVGAAEYFETPVTAWLARSLNLVPVDPDANLLPAMQAAAFGLNHGKVLVLFPEGERSIDGTVKTFKKGAAILSRHLGVPIVPVALGGIFDIWPRSRPLAWRRLLPWSGHRTIIRFGPPVNVPESECSYADHIAAVRAAVDRLWRES